ncbi:MAG: tetratricopeptide repeat protein [Bradymonadia bacterium]
MFLKWLKDRNKGENTEVEPESTAPVGMGTIDLNPFGKVDEQSETTDAETSLMPAVQDDGATEIWQTVGPSEGEQEDRDGVQHSVDQYGMAPPQTSFVHEPSVTSTPPADLGIVIPSLRIQAIELRNRLDQRTDDGEPEEVARLWKAYLRLVPSDTNGWLSLGELHLSQGQLETAQAVFRAALEFQPDDALTNGALGHTLMTRGQFSEARQFLALACEQMPNELELQMVFLDYLKACGDDEDATRQSTIVEELRRGAR